MAVSEEKERELREEMKKLGLKEVDIQEKFIIGSGRGGQNLQKTASCVYLKHLPTGIIVKCQKDRSRQVNRFLARRRLLEAFKENYLEIRSKKQDQIEKIRKAKKRRQRRQKSSKSSNSKSNT